MEKQKSKTLSEIYQQNREKLDNKEITTTAYGEKFEWLILRYLKTTKTYNFTDVWLWGDFPYRLEILDGRDTGIDIVARTTTNEYYAIQCKFRPANNTIDKNTIQSFKNTANETFHDEKESRKFDYKILFTTANHLSLYAKELASKDIINIQTLTDLENSDVDWGQLEKGIIGINARKEVKKPRDHQIEAIESAEKHYETKDRGNLIMACGTGKTYTSLKILEKLLPEKGVALYLVPSISLMNQTIKAYNNDSIRSLHRLCICSDAKVSKSDSDKDSIDLAIEALLYPATTNLEKLKTHWNKIKSLNDRDLTIVFSTYQSIDVVKNFAQKENIVFDFIVCDEAHRTASLKIRDNEARLFARVHDNKVIPALKRLYMTATKKIYDSASKKEAELHDTIVYSMDNEAQYGKTFYQLTFGKAIEKELLSDYQVVVFHADPSNYDWIEKLSEEEQKGNVKISYEYTVTENGVKKTKSEPNLPISLAKLIKLRCCINVLKKENLEIEKGKKLAGNTKPMKSILLFENRIKESKAVAGAFQKAPEILNYKDDFKFDVRHIDGTMHSFDRQSELSWLENAGSVYETINECRGISNVRCFTEGVDVPALDAIIFLGTKREKRSTVLIDIVQSVGRVMRKAPGKDVGYIIIPIVIKPGQEINEVLKDSSYNIIWDVLNALKSHDDRLDKELASAQYYGDITNLTQVGTKNRETNPYTNGTTPIDISLYLENLKNPFRARLVKKVGVVKSWKKWGEDMVETLKKEKNRISNLIHSQIANKTAHNDKINVAKEFQKFHVALKGHLNEGISEEDTLDILAQQSLTKQIFDKFFPDYFKTKNQVGIQLEKIVELFKAKETTEFNKQLKGFSDSVAYHLKGIKTIKGKQKLLKDVYEKFFKEALPDLKNKLGIVYTPNEVVDFIIHSVDDLLKKEFNLGISDRNVNVLDPFTGTGTFITQLLYSDIIKDKDFIHKYRYEIHASELVLLAYYIADTNIVATFSEEIEKRNLRPLISDYKFNNILLRDTFQKPSPITSSLFPQHYEKIREQDNKQIQVIIGNPPYSSGQKRSDENLKNQKYPNLHERIKNTYAKELDSSLKKNLYDSYYKAFRWASDKIQKNNLGVIGFVTPVSWIDSDEGQGFRRTLETEFSSIYIFNLRGNTRKKGEENKKEGGGFLETLAGPQ